MAHSTYLCLLNYDPRQDATALLAEHERWAGRHARLPAPPPHANPPDPDRRLRVGYVSPDFRAHAASYFLEPILAHHDRGRVECFCYADVAAPDARTAHLRTLADHWRDITGVPVDQVAELVRQDGIDILVELAGHTADNRLLVFARKPAPVQVSYLGYPCTTGLRAIDYRLVDAVTDPPGEPRSSTEEPVYLAPAFCCYAPPREAPPVLGLPALEHGRVTFGSRHKLDKLNDAVLDLWCQVLADVPGSRLLLCRHVLHGRTAERLRQRFVARGVDPARLVLRRVEPADFRHLHAYHDIDIALDPFPWNGHTTACEALWMGVPVVSLRGDRYAGRMVASVLTCVGLAELVAGSPAAYRATAVRLAADPAKLANLRQSLRARLLASPLCDGARFARALEATYLRLWQPWWDQHQNRPAGPA